MSGIELLLVVGGKTQTQAKARTIRDNRVWNRADSSGLWGRRGRRGNWIYSM